MSTTIQELIIASNTLVTARDLLKKSIQTEPTNVELHKALRDACIQRFEFCVELKEIEKLIPELDKLIIRLKQKS